LVALAGGNDGKVGEVLSNNYHYTTMQLPENKSQLHSTHKTIESLQCIIVQIKISDDNNNKSHTTQRCKSGKISGKMYVFHILSSGLHSLLQ
jgi:hypothetical protein